MKHKKILSTYKSMYLVSENIYKKIFECINEEQKKEILEANTLLKNEAKDLNPLPPLLEADSKRNDSSVNESQLESSNSNLTQTLNNSSSQNNSGNRITGISTLRNI